METTTTVEDKRIRRIEYQRAYRKANKERISESAKVYNEANKEHIAKQKATKHTCECGGPYTTAHKARHEKSTPHLLYIEHLKRTVQNG